MDHWSEARRHRAIHPCVAVQIRKPARRLRNPTRRGETQLRIGVRQFEYTELGLAAGELPDRMQLTEEELPSAI